MTLSGQVTDPVTGETIPGVVIFDLFGNGTVTDGNGSYSFDTELPGQITADFYGRKQTKQVTENPTNFELPATDTIAAAQEWDIRNRRGLLFLALLIFIGAMIYAIKKKWLWLT